MGMGIHDMVIYYKCEMICLRVELVKLRKMLKNTYILSLEAFCIHIHLHNSGMPSNIPILSHYRKCCEFVLCIVSVHVGFMSSKYLCSCMTLYR